MAAAPADFRASDPATDKLKREGSLDLHLEPTEDILAGLASSRTDEQTIVGFAAEHGNDIDRAREKLQRKGADLIVLNDVSDPTIGFESTENAATLISSTEETTLAASPQGRNSRADPRPGRPTAPGGGVPSTGGYSERPAGPRVGGGDSPFRRTCLTGLY